VIILGFESHFCHCTAGDVASMLYNHAGDQQLPVVTQLVFIL